MTLIKLIVGIAMITLAGFVLLGEHLAGTSADAVINSQVTGVQTPIAGKLSLTGASIGARVRKGEPLGQISDLQADTVRLNDLTVELASGQAEVARQVNVVTRVRALITSLGERARRYHEAKLNRLRADREAARALERVAEAELSYARQMLERSETLTERGIGTVALRDEARNRVEVAARRTDNARQQSIAIDTTLQAAEAGVYAGDSYNDQPYSEQRISELQVRESEAQTALEAAQANVAALQRRLDAERLRVNRLNASTLSAHVNGIVWTIAAADGETVQRGQTVLQLIDCDATVITLSVSESIYNRLGVGQRARFRPTGRSDVYDATIVRLAGAGASSLYRNLAVAPSEKHLERYDVTLQVPGLASDPDLRCGIGRTGRAFFDGRPFDWLRDWLR